ncbi:hypothetical protein DFH09DRAFT_1082621 [Mycena vulgaris]|nr:hypothetical protein DFH09DRAFT_1082621 [Mycena vulgaris]
MSHQSPAASVGRSRHISLTEIQSIPVQGNGPGRIYMIVAYHAGIIPSEIHDIIGQILTFMTLWFSVRSRFERGPQSANAGREPGVRFSHSGNPEPERRVRFG